LQYKEQVKDAYRFSIIPSAAPKSCTWVMVNSSSLQ